MLSTETLGDLSGMGMAITGARLVTSAFLAILFIQSGLDKVFDRAGNISWISEHFANSPLATHVPWLLTIVTIAELLAGGLAALSVAALLGGGGLFLGFSAALLSALSLIMLFFGQRMAKDYEGAGVLVPYFAVVVMGMALYL